MISGMFSEFDQFWRNRNLQSIYYGIFSLKNRCESLRSSLPTVAHAHRLQITGTLNHSYGISERRRLSKLVTFSPLDECLKVWWYWSLEYTVNINPWNIAIFWAQFWLHLVASKAQTECARMYCTDPMMVWWFTVSWKVRIWIILWMKSLWNLITFQREWLFQKSCDVIYFILWILRWWSGTLICNLESKAGDRGKYIRASGCVGAIVSHTYGSTIIRLPSGQKKIVRKESRAMVGVVAGGGRPEKPMLKAGRAYHKYKVKRNCWPRVSGVCMNPVEHPHGGGNHQHVGMPTTVGKYRCAGRKVGLIGARRTGRGRERAKVKF